ncbi:MAG: hypothetical protein WKG07_41245 [Hymenobacter sp.]
MALFGVNYTAPFAYSYRALRQLNIRPEDAIDQDVYHLSRLERLFGSTSGISRLPTRSATYRRMSTCGCWTA